MPDTPHVLIVASCYHEAIVDALLDGARHALDAAGATHETATVPGALELPGAISLAVMGMEGDPDAPHYDGFVALGCVIRGETSHHDVVANASARGIMELTLEGTCVGNGIVTVENEAQARARARRDGKDRGGEAARAALALIALKDRFLG